MKLGRFAARLVIGGLFVGHGSQKLFGSFGGPGLAGTEGMMGQLGMHPAKANAYAAGVTETAGGALLALGAATPAAAAGLIGTMVVAIRKVHLSNGPWAANGGYEYNLVLIAALLALLDGGPGELSVDHLLGIDETDHRWSLAALVAALVTSTAAIELGRRNAPAGDPAGAGAPAGGADTDVAGDPVTQD